MVSVPVFNVFNHNHVRILLNLFPHPGSTLPGDNKLYEYAADICGAVDGFLDDQCSLATTRVHSERVNLFETPASRN